MAKKRLSLDLDLDDYNDKKIWDFLETKKVKSKAIKSVLNAYLDGIELPKPNTISKNEEVKEDVEEKLKVDDMDPDVFGGF